MSPSPEQSGAIIVPGGRFEFKSYDQFAAAIREVGVNGFILSRETRPWVLESYRTGDATFQHGVGGAPTVTEAQMPPGRTGLVTPARGTRPQLVNGRDPGEGSVIVLGPGELIRLSTREPADWYSVIVPVEALHEQVRLMHGDDAKLDLATRGIPNVAEQSAWLQGLVTETIRAIASAPAGLRPEAVKQIERLALRGVAEFHLRAATAHGGTRALRVDRTVAVRAIHDFLSALTDRPVYVEDLCRATGLPERTLRLIFMELFGESPVRVLRARRLCLVFEALQSEGVGLKQIRHVAESHGFWHMGQFSADYRKLLGERPSDTVKRARLEGRRPAPAHALPNLAALGANPGG